MNLDKIIKAVITKKLNNYEFTFKKNNISNSWLFQRICNDVFQQIIIQKSNFDQRLDVILSTSVSPDKLMAHQLVDDRMLYGSSYKDETSLHNILIEICELIIKDGIECLNLMSIPDIKPKKEMSYKLLEKPMERAESFEKKYKINCSNDMEVLKEIKNNLTQNNTISLENASHLLVDASAFLGKVIIDQMGGEWIWDEYFELAMLDNIGETHIKDSPLVWCINYWQKPNMKTYDLTRKYTNLTKLIQEIKSQ